MNEQLNGGQAFPSGATSGMTLRDYFAAQALQGSLASDTPDYNYASFDARAANCYELADAMLKARAA